MDGHDYVEAALANGAVAAVVSNHWLAPDEAALIDPCKLLRVPEGEDCVLEGDADAGAGRVRQQWGGRVIGVTGFGGQDDDEGDGGAGAERTVLRCLSSAGNLNNHFGVAAAAAAPGAGRMRSRCSRWA